MLIHKIYNSNNHDIHALNKTSIFFLVSIILTLSLMVEKDIQVKPCNVHCIFFFHTVFPPLNLTHTIL